MDAGDLLKAMLPMAVPLKILDFKQIPWSEIQTIATEASQFIGEHGDNILFLGPKKGDTAKAFNMLVKGIAALSFVPGGVKLFGLHFEAIHPESLESGPGRWLYHSTFADAIPGIAKSGLMPDTEGKLFFAGTQPMAAGYTEMLFAKNLEANGWSWDPVLLRVHSAHLGDIEQDRHSFEDWHIGRTVSPVFIQAWVPEKEAWVEVREAEEQGYFRESRTKYGEPGKIDVEPDATPANYAGRYIEQLWPKE